MIRWWFAAAPAERLAAFRIVLGLYVTGDLAIRLPSLLHYAAFPAHEWKPVGICVVAPHPLAPVIGQLLVIAALGLAVAFTLGWRFRIVAPVFAAVLLWVLTSRNSWGMEFHTENLEVLHVAIVAFAPAAAAWSLDARGREPPGEVSGWALRAAAAVTAITYVLAGVAKLRIAGAGWLDGHQLRDQIAYDNLRLAVYGARTSFFAIPLLERPWIGQVLAGLTLVVELGAPLAMVHRRAAVVWSIVAWSFHVGVLAMMHIAFPYPLCGLAFAPLFRLERLRSLRFGRRGSPAARSESRPGTP